MAFLDCICCGFGSVLLIFILSVGQMSSAEKLDADAARAAMQELDARLATLRSAVDKLTAAGVPDSDIEGERVKGAELEALIKSREQALAQLIQQEEELKDRAGKLIGEKLSLPTQEKPAPIPIPNTDRRSYLSGMKLGAGRLLFLVEASGGMLDYTIDGAFGRLQDSDAKRREAPKWKQVVKAVEWMIATLPPETRFQVLVFNTETNPLVPSRADEWIEAGDRKGVTDVVNRLEALVPRGSANLERAFNTVRYLPDLPDSIVLFTDGLPTSSDSVSGQSDTDVRMRTAFFRAAERQLPPRIPVNTILFPMDGDPSAPALLWTLGLKTNGALISPARDWPELVAKP